MKTAIITDTHFGARSDSLAFNNFFAKFYREVFFPKLDSEGITTVFHLGDTFDRRKYVNFKTLQSCREFFFDECKKRNINLVMLVGNHDTFFKNTNDVNSVGLLLKDYDNIKYFDSPSEYEIDGTSILMLPWICQENYKDCMDAIKNTKSSVLFGHLEIAGFQMHLGQESHDGFDPSIFEKFDLVCSGHYHHRSSNRNITYLGNPYEMTWSDHNDPRGFHLFDTTTRELTFVVNPFKMFHKIYYDDISNEMDTEVEKYEGSHLRLIVVNKKDYYKFDKFVEKLEAVNPLELKIIEDLTDFEDGTVDDSIDIEDTVTLLSHFVDSVETDMNKEKLKTLLKTLYVEALTMEKDGNTV